MHNRNNLDWILEECIMVSWYFSYYFSNPSTHVVQVLLYIMTLNELKNLYTFYNYIIEPYIEVEELLKSISKNSISC